MLDRTVNDKEEGNGMMLTTIENPDPKEENNVKFDIGKDQTNNRKRNLCIGVLIFLFVLLCLAIGLSIGYLA